MIKTIKRSEVREYIKTLNDIVGDSSRMTIKIQIKVAELGFWYHIDTEWYTNSRAIKEMTIDGINYLTIGLANHMYHEFPAYVIEIVE